MVKCHERKTVSDFFWQRINDVRLSNSTRRRTMWIMQFRMLLMAGIAGILLHSGAITGAESPRERISINEDWRFYKYDSIDQADELIYDVRPEVKDDKDDRPADAKPTEAVAVETRQQVLKSWILPAGNDFVKDPAKRHVRPDGNPGGDFPYVQGDFDESSWESVDLPHDWAIKGPFYKGWNTAVGGGMGRLPSPGVAWYRKKLDIPGTDAGKSIFLDVDGAMSYAMVWLNGRLVGGRPYGYASWRLDLTGYIVPGGENQLAIRLDNPPDSSRWYPGGGIYRNVWLTKTHPVHVGQWGTLVTTRDVSEASAIIDLEVTIDNHSRNDADIEALTQVFVLDAYGNKTDGVVARFEPLKTSVAAGESAKVKSSVTLENPCLWGPPPTQTPHLYVAVTTLRHQGNPVDQYETRFGIRSLRFDPDTGIHVNGERIYIKGANQHHDLGALGAAFNTRAAQRQLEILREMGCNAIRTAHNPPAPEFLELTDRMGFLVVNEIFDVWERKKTPLDFHLIFPDWHEQDLRGLVRRDRNCPSVIMWSFGNEVGEQYTGEQGAAVAKRLHDITRDEDPTRPTTCAMNWAKPNMPLPEVPDVISLNYQGEGIRNAPAYSGLKGINTPPLYPAFHEAFPDKPVISSENAAALSSRGTYLFPVFDGISAPVKDGLGGDPKNQYVSAYELYTADFGSSADKVFASLDKHPYVAGGFVWSGWDYLGEPTPYYGARSSYFGVIDLAGFKKDRFYLYQSCWRPDFPMCHILPHWTWPERVGQITPVHVFTSGDEAELFLNGRSLGRKKKIFDTPGQAMDGGPAYRIRWDDIVYEPGELKVVAFKDGKEWATDIMHTAGGACQMDLKPDRATISADGRDLSFVTLTIQDSNGIMVPRANNLIRFLVSGPGEIVATDNGDPTNLVSFASHEREAFNGLCLVIVRGKPGQPGTIRLKAESDSLESATVTLQSVAENANTGVAQHADSEEGPKAKPGENPIIWADVPDPSVIRVGDTYYMSSTTMHMNPGAAIMKSKNLINWEIVNYAYDILADNDVLALCNGQQAYGKGSWASSLRYHDGTYYVSTFSYSTERTHVYKTKDIENGPWTESMFRPPLHDMSLFFEDDGRVFMTYGSGDIKIIELTSDASAIKPGGLDQVIIEDASLVAGPNVGLKAEGSHLYKINGKYYIFLITWPKGGMRTELVFRSDHLTGPYVGKVALSDRGIAQGGIVETPKGDWYAMLFRDSGAVGRIPWLVPVTWEDGWPVFGIYGNVPEVLDIMAEPQDIPGIVASDEFNRSAQDPELPLEWQWNHNPDSSYWSIGERPGYLRLTNGRIDTSILDTKNTLTQRTFGPECSARVAMDTGNMKNGDVAGLAAFQKNFGYVGVKMSGNTKSIVMVNAGGGSPVEVASVPLDQERVHLKVTMDYRNRTDKAYFYYSLDNIEWQVIGNTLQMSYTLPHFMGYRFALFNYATESAGGFVDFDFFRVDNNLTLVKLTFDDGIHIFAKKV
ncbi:MAG: family 43 glycosylhydrolase [Sedimentisphaerales bacterium]|nr:family 43 glycosylhydrolase [Sedimentisphaerales bacterium]